MAITTKTDICNLALNHVGNDTTVSNIDTPTNDKERIFALCYDDVRRIAINETMPNFALFRFKAAKLIEEPAFGYRYVYAIPNYVLRVLGIGNAEDKENNYSIENNRIYTDTDYSDGLPVRCLRDVTDVTKYGSNFCMLLSWYLAAHTCLMITQDAQKANAIQQMLPSKISSLSGLNSQENMPVRISRSRFRAARYSYNPSYTVKK